MLRSRVRFVVCSLILLQDDDNRRIVETTMSTFGALHMSFINAGVTTYVPLEGITEEIVDEVFDSNFKGVVFGLKHQIPSIAKTWDKGSIVVSSSIGGTKVNHMFPGISLYSSSKAAVEMVVKYGAVEGAPMKVRVNAIAPTSVRTPLAKGIMEDSSIVGEVNDGIWKAANLIDKEVTINNGVLENKPNRTLPVWGHSQQAAKHKSGDGEVISLVMFLFSDDSEALTGTIVPCDMGSRIKT